MSEFKRLYPVLQPEHYDLLIDVDRGKKLISGKTTITANAKQPAVAVHQKDLTVSAVIVDGQEVDFSVDNEAELINITLPNTGNTTITIEYTAPLTDTMMGIYPSYYEVDGVKKQLVGTQFETNFARQAFPCVDEPEAKATFSLAIKFDEQPGETVISNMPEVKQEDGVHYFEPTVRMSTYLVAFGFGDLQSKFTTTKSGVKVGVFATKAHQPKELDFAVDIAKRSIEFYEDFYQTPYPLPHSWQLALPDFSAGAMENWGLVTYREAYLLLDPDNTSLSTKQLVATVIAHELAHQWFGDLVTMQWWDDLWLNESFANMMEYVAVAAIEPKWNIWESFQTSEVPAALQRDATDGVQSVHVEVNHPAEIDALFDGAIVYAKGARMLVMVRALIGDDALREGLKQYFAAHKYGNAKGDDLWNALGKASGIDLAKIMKTWLEQPGYPVVTAEVDNNGQLTLTQKQFFIGEGEDQNRLWQIPLNSNYSAAPTILAEPKVALGDYNALRKHAGKPFRVNVGNNSHFIVKYDDTLLGDILKSAADLGPIDQMQILQDLRLLSEADQVKYGSVFPVLKRFADSQSAVVIDGLYRLAAKFKDFVTPDSAAEGDLRRFFNQLSADQAARLGWQPQAGESNDDQLSRPTILSAALYGKNAQSIQAAHELFTANQHDLFHISADVRALVLINEVENYGNQALFDHLLTEYRKTSDASYKSDLSRAVTHVKQPELVAELVAKFEDSDTIKPQDLRAWYFGTVMNNEGQQAAWDWIRNDWQWLEDTVGGDMEFATFITVTARAFHTAQRLAEFKAFFEPKLATPGLTREIKMDVKTIETKVALIESEKDSVAEALKNN
ncbi:M1 family metallopeptidase (plasmid) [Nicoliella spurrieriana]|uniref:Aminopeptidase n=1 Tax=Nicoliella spurrieriana TaxID=2925830 RepID=A0A976RQY4_9LACO|nr:M1 family metallopeptidase [Nicoliella spurrieriana]UQS86209.1 M1 family metallopeptidase [Nicoliella spurrieriana]